MNSKVRENLLAKYILPALINEAKEYGLDLSKYAPRLVAEDEHSLSAVFFENEKGRWVAARFSSYGEYGKGADKSFIFSDLKFELSWNTEATMIEYLPHED